MVEDFSEFSVWLLGYRVGQPAVPGQLVRLNASVPSLTAALKTGVLTMVGTAPMNSALQVTGVRILYATQTIRAGRAETPPLGVPARLEAGKAVVVVYDLASGKLTLTPQ